MKNAERTTEAIAAAANAWNMMSRHLNRCPVPVAFDWLREALNTDDTATVAKYLYHAAADAVLIDYCDICEATLAVNHIPEVYPAVRCGAENGAQLAHLMATTELMFRTLATRGDAMAWGDIEDRSCDLRFTPTTGIAYAAGYQFTPEETAVDIARRRWRGWYLRTRKACELCYKIRIIQKKPGLSL